MSYLNLILLFITVGAFIGLYLSFFYVKQLNDVMAAISNEKNLSEMMTVDGLLTTATFAFIAFISISPNSSGSSISMNRVAWKGFWVFRYSFLLILTALITIVNFMLGFNQYIVLVGIGTIISGVILILIILKYVFNNKNLNQTSANKITKIISNPFSERSFKKAFRNLIHPLRETRNTDFLKEILVSKHFIKHVTSVVWIVKEEWDNNSNQKEDVGMVSLLKFHSIIRSNKKLTPDEKMEIAIWVHLKVISRIKKKKLVESDISLEKVFRVYSDNYIDADAITEPKRKKLIKKTTLSFASKQFTDRINHTIFIKGQKWKK